MACISNAKGRHKASLQREEWAGKQVITAKSKIVPRFIECRPTVTMEE